MDFYLDWHRYIKFSNTDIILGTPSDIPLIFDLYLIITKIHLYCCKFQNVVPGIAKRVAYIEKKIALKNNKIQTFHKKWLRSDPPALTVIW